MSSFFYTRAGKKVHAGLAWTQTVLWPHLFANLISTWNGSTGTEPPSFPPYTAVRAPVIPSGV